MRPALLYASAAALLLGCADSSVAPRDVGLVLTAESVSPDSTLVGIPGLPLPGGIVVRAADREGRAVPGARITWTVTARGSGVEPMADTTDEGGYAEATWVLGTDAAEPQSLKITVGNPRGSASLAFRGRAVPSEVAAIRFAVDTMVARVGVPTPLRFEALDPYGNAFTPPLVSYGALDTAAAVVDQDGMVTPVQRGPTSVVVKAGEILDTTVVLAIQVVDSIVLAQRTISFHSIGQEVPLGLALIDDQGQPVLDSLPDIEPRHPDIVEIRKDSAVILRSKAAGTTGVTVRAGSTQAEVHVVVDQRVFHVALGVSADTLDALRDTLRLTASLRDSLGWPVPDAIARYTSSDGRVASVDGGGLVTSVGNGTARIVARSESGVSDTMALLVAQRTVTIAVDRDSLRFDALGAVEQIGARPLDRLGQIVHGADVSYAIDDPAIASVSSSGEVTARTNGVTRVRVRSDPESLSVPVLVSQRPVRVVLAQDTMRFAALEDTVRVHARALDSLGSALSDTTTSVTLTATGVVDQPAPGLLRARANGTAAATVTVADLSTALTAIVQQEPDSLHAEITGAESILALAGGATLPVTCQAFDRNRYPIPTSVAVLPSPSGRWDGETCMDLRLQRSGVDTLRIRAGTLAVELPVALAVAPTVVEPLGTWLAIDSLPSGTKPWAPSLHQAPDGTLELYFAAYPIAETGAIADVRAHLHRAISVDGAYFEYDGVVLRHDDDVCALHGSGIENVNIVPRSDGPGWRMFFAAGSFPCYGWQVFSAVSGDGRNWTKEPGIRLSNGAPPPPSPPSYAPWPAGEGMVTDRLPDGEWRMIVSTYEHLDPYEDKFQITEWRSPDQLTWTYRGPVLTTRDMPPGGAGTIYSPTITEIAPGLWRMIFAGDNRREPGWRGRLWSAVSTDRQSWQLEGELLGDPNTRVWYSTLANDRLVFLRQDTGQNPRLAIATLVMP